MRPVARCVAVSGTSLASGGFGDHRPLETPERAAGTRPANQGQDVLIQLQSPQVPLVGPEAVPVEHTPLVLQ